MHSEKVIQFLEARGVMLSAIIFAVSLLYSPVLSFGFLHYDDALYVTANKHIADQWSWGTFIWSWEHLEFFYHPLTWLSLQLDASLYSKANPGGFHLTNVVLHILNTILGFHLLRQLNASLAVSALAVLVWAIHPINVEAVAWISERKGLLAAFFAQLSLMFYIRFYEKTELSTFYLSVAGFTLSVLAKPSYLLLPIILLFGTCLKDRRTLSWRSVGATSASLFPFFLIALLAGVLNVMAASNSESVSIPDAGSLWTRFICCVWSLEYYILGIFFPVYFSPLEMLSSAQPWSTVCGVVLCSSLILLWCVSKGDSGRVLTCAVAIALLLMIPILGVVQIGNHYAASRYAYLASLVLIAGCVWYAEQKAISRPTLTFGLVVTASLGLSYSSFNHVEKWRSDIDLFLPLSHSNPQHFAAHANLGYAYEKIGRTDLAEAYYRMAIRANQWDNRTPRYLALLLIRSGALGEALTVLSEAPASVLTPELIWLLSDRLSAAPLNEKTQWMEIWNALTLKRSSPTHVQL